MRARAQWVGVSAPDPWPPADETELPPQLQDCDVFEPHRGERAGPDQAARKRTLAQARTASRRPGHAGRAQPGSIQERRQIGLDSPPGLGAVVVGDATETVHAERDRRDADYY